MKPNTLALPNPTDKRGSKNRNVLNRSASAAILPRKLKNVLTSNKSGASAAATPPLAPHAPVGGKRGSVLWGMEVLDDVNFPIAYNFVKCCIVWLKKNNAHLMEGIFRHSGNEIRLDELQKDFNQQLQHGGLNPDFKLEEKEDPYTISTLLKRFFRAMKTPLLTFEMYPAFIATNRYENEDRLKSLKKALVLLPRNNRIVLELLCRYLNDVSKNEKQNFMSAKNLAIVIAPNILWPSERTAMSEIGDAPHVTGTITCIISEAESLFDEDQVKVDVEEFQGTMKAHYLAHKKESRMNLQLVKYEEGLDDETFKHTLEALSEKIRDGDESTVNILITDEDGKEKKKNRLSKNLLSLFNENPEALGDHKHKHEDVPPVPPITPIRRMKRRVSEKRLERKSSNMIEKHKGHPSIHRKSTSIHSDEVIPSHNPHTTTPEKKDCISNSGSPSRPGGSPKFSRSNTNRPKPSKQYSDKGNTKVIKEKSRAAPLDLEAFSPRSRSMSNPVHLQNLIEVGKRSVLEPPRPKDPDHPSNDHSSPRKNVLFEDSNSDLPIKPKKKIEIEKTLSMDESVLRNIVVDDKDTPKAHRKKRRLSGRKLRSSSSKSLLSKSGPAVSGPLSTPSIPSLSSAGSSLEVDFSRENSVTDLSGSDSGEIVDKKADKDKKKKKDKEKEKEEGKTKLRYHKRNVG